MVIIIICQFHMGSFEMYFPEVVSLVLICASGIDLGFEWLGLACALISSFDGWILNLIKIVGKVRYVVKPGNIEKWRKIV